MLPELRCEMRLTVDRATEGDFVLEAAGPSDRLPFRALEDRTHFLWVYTELFTRFGVQLPFTEFQMEVLSWCRVVASQLHLNGWGFLRTFERVCLHFGFRPSWHSIQEFKWHYFKVLPFLGKRPFWLDDEGAPFPWVYWNAEVGDFRISALDPLETLAFEFLQFLPVGLGKKSNFKCRWILDHSDVDKMNEAEGTGPRSILPTSRAQTVASGASASGPVASAFTPVPLAPSSSASKAGGKPTSAAVAKPFSVEGEEGAREDPAADLRQKRRKRKTVEASTEEAALGGDSAWKHKGNPIDRAFPPDYNFRAALDAGLTNGPIREILQSGRFLAPWFRSSFLGLLSSLPVGVENTFAAKVQLEKELAATKDQVDVLIADWDSALAAPLLHAKIKSLSKKLERAEGEWLSAFERMKEVKERAKVQAAELESCRSALAQERKKRGEWKSLTEETREMVQETFEILMDQGEPEPVAVDRPEPVAEEQPEVQPEQRVEDVVAREGGGCPI
ncbi:hypothetical protein PIB30_086914 [Stylosanthes scabra]|uniref:Aminotransferase-like plant mobile domain-containing protein n=1 Tax=Stylosanthes scabra TaxID=79078 RepID=A0ABU6WV20_9FABA|nr:hypothetical protein [Stylosanthes scabra]